MSSICHLTSVHTRYDIRIFSKECNSLIKEGYNVSLIVADGKGDEVVNGIKIYDVGKPQGRLQRMLLSTKKIFKKAISLDVMVYHFHDPELLPIGKILMKKGKKVVYDVHEDYRNKMASKSYIPHFIEKVFSLLIGLYEDRCMKKFSGIITTTDFVFNRFRYINHNIVCIKNYPINDLNDNNVYEKLPNSCVFAGTLSKNLCIWEMVEALYLTRSKTVLYLAGRWSDEKYRKKVMSSAGWSQVVFLGFCSRDTVQRIMRESYVGLVIQRDNADMRQAISTKLFEYMENGLPIVSSALPLHQEINKEYFSQILVDPLDTVQIAAGIDYLLNNKNTAKQMGINGKRAVNEKYNWISQEKILISFYNKI